MIGFLTTREKTIETWVDEAYSAITTLFPSKKDFIKYLNLLKDPKDAEILIRICQYYLVAKEYQPSSFVKLIMIISAIERLQNREKKYQEFYNWIDSKTVISKVRKELSGLDKFDIKDFRKIIREIKKDYSELYGSQRNVIDFLEKHLASKDKIKLITSIRANVTDATSGLYPKIFGLEEIHQHSMVLEILEKNNFKVEKRLMTYCYNLKRCNVAYGDCDPSFGCLLLEKPNYQKKILKKVIRDIYQIRSDFIHDARITTLNEKDSVGTLSVIRSKKGKVKRIVIELTAEKLESMFEKALKHYFDELVT